MGHKPAGGLRSNKVTHVGVRTGAPRHGVNPRWTSQVGQSYGNHATERVGMMPESKVIERYRAGPGVSVPLGNEIATNVGRGGPGAGRTLYGQSGSNQTYGPVASNSRATPGEKVTGRDTLAEYGAEIGGRRR